LLAAFILVGLVGLAVGVHELRTSYAQAALFARITSAFGFELREGRSDLIRFPADGPYDQRHGYSRIPSLIERLDSLGFEVTHQARLTRSLARWVDRGLYPIYRAKGAVGLRVEDRVGRVLVDERFPVHAYADFDSIPELLWRTLVYIETQGMLDVGTPRRNPAVEWDRLAFSAANLALREIGTERHVPGGSTLATQIEKYRHSPGGITRSPSDKLRQMLSATLRAYSEGPDTYEHRRRIVTEYLNSVPLAGQVGHGEVVGIGAGLWVWYGTPFAEANAALRTEPGDALARVRRARIYRQALSLLVAQRRPTHYLAHVDGRASLASLTDVYLRLLERDGVIPGSLAQDARRAGAPSILTSAPLGGRPAPVTSDKGANAVKAHLLGVTTARNVYELDRLDLSVRTTLDAGWESTAAALLDDMRSGEFLAAEGFRQQGLLAAGDPTRVLYSVLLMERTDLGNVIRLQTDNFRGDLRLADGSRLELGSTAKLRVLVTYLEVVEELHGRLSPLDADALRASADPARDDLTRWVARAILERPDASLDDVLAAALERRYSASPHERFFTGGTELTFSNFDNQFDQRVMTVREAFRHSVNLPFIRLMRDIVSYEVAQLGSAALFASDVGAWRHEYLVKFTEHEGAEYVRRFYRGYRDRSGHEVFDALLRDRQLTATQIAWAVRAVAPDVSQETFADLIRSYGPEPSVSDGRVADLHTRTDAVTLPLSDLGHLSRIHPLELWVASHRLHHPGAALGDFLTSSRGALVDVYGWLLRTSRAHAQDTRIRTMLEIEAFQRIHARWRHLRFPFDDLTPSLGTAIGSSGDRPLALAELAGIILNDGVGLPVVRVEEMRFAEGTPFETRVALRPAMGERRLGPEVAALMKEALLDVVESGTGRRARGALAGPGGQPLDIGGKTGTGDNRHRVYDERGRLVESRVVNRTAAFVFIAGDRYFGVVTAHVAGPAAEAYRFTSALPTQLLRVMGQRLGAPPADAPAADPRPANAPPLRVAASVRVRGPRPLLWSEVSSRRSQALAALAMADAPERAIARARSPRPERAPSSRAAPTPPRRDPPLPSRRRHTSSRRRSWLRGAFPRSGCDPRAARRSSRRGARSRSSRRSR
jgi:membrane peptidoglycan carboxypeptidase